MALLMLNERVVVVAFIARIVLFTSSSSSLFYESLSLFILSFFALALDFYAQFFPSSIAKLFTTRKDTSSGIMLGAVTFPGLMLSKLIQMSRGLESPEVSLEEFEYLRFQYWASSASCFSVVVFLFFILPHQRSNNNSAHSWVNWYKRIGLSCIASFSGTLILAFSTYSQDGWYAVLLSFWMMFHGFATVKLIKHILDTFPECASIGEALLVSSGIVVYFGDFLANTACKVHGHIPLIESLPSLNGIKRSEISTIIQGLILGLLLFSSVMKFVHHNWGRQADNENHQLHVKRSLLFYAVLAMTLFLAVPSWMQFVQNFDIHPFLWIIGFVCSEPAKRLSFCICWAVAIYTSVRIFYRISQDGRTERILLRKYYHLLAVLMFIPALLLQPELLNLALGAALAVFLILEFIRIWMIWPLGQHVHHFMNAFKDHRDSDLLVISHFSLLLGCALPIWFSSGFNDRPLAPFAGILSLGIGDTMASMVGHKYGVVRWSENKKTIEGTAAGITSVLVACTILLPYLARAGYIFSQACHFFLHCLGHEFLGQLS
ncbi:hypothetical protein Leryth_000725 [Lithospermum erythrorhizon]|nr:hypothetical protein Leryth_000725 [Lithospermum erythrorhizon]